MKDFDSNELLQKARDAYNEANQVKDLIEKVRLFALAANLYYQLDLLISDGDKPEEWK